MMICTFWAMLVGCSLTQFITDLIAALLSTKSVLEPPETWMVPEAAVSNPPRSSRRCSSPSTVDSAARRACYDQPGPALPGGRAAAVRVRGPKLGEYADSLVAKAQVRATPGHHQRRRLQRVPGPALPGGDARRVAGTPSPESRDWLKDDDE